MHLVFYNIIEQVSNAVHNGIEYSLPKSTLQALPTMGLHNSVKRYIQIDRAKTNDAQ